MKLWAIVDKDGDVIIASAHSAGDAWGACAKDSDEAESMRAMGYRCIELHTYNPSTRVVIDREVYGHMCGLTKAVIKDKQKYEGEPIKPIVKQFLSAGEVK